MSEPVDWSPFPPSVPVALEAKKDVVAVIRRLSDAAGLTTQQRVDVYRLIAHNLTVVADQLDESGG